MSILNVNQIQPVGGGNTITVSASDVSASGATITASSFVGNITSSSTSEFSSGLNVTGGSIGINTTAPAEKLDVWGTIRASEGTSQYMHMYPVAGAGYFDVSNSTTYPSIVFRQIGSGGTQERVRITSGGQVGIGTDNPTKKLQVFDSSATSTTARANTVARFLSNASNADCNIQLSNGVDHSAQIGIVGNGAEVYIAQDGIERLRIASNGRVGIATDNPDARLSVSDQDGSVLKVASSVFKVNQTHTSWANTTYAENPIIMWDYKSGPGDHLFFASGGNTAVGDQMAMLISDDHGFKVGKSGFDGTDTDVDADNEFFRITNSGDVGIGTDNPRNTAKLDVHNSTSSGVYINYDGKSNTEYGLRIESNAAGGNFESDFLNGTTALLDLYANSSTVTGGDLLVARTQSSTPVLLVKGNGDIGIANTSPSNWGSGVPTLEIKGNSSSQPTRGGFLGFESYSGTDGYGGLWLNNDQLSFWLGESRYVGGSSYATPQERLRIAYADYPYIGISTNGTFRDQRLPLVIHGQGFGHGQTQQGTTQDTIYLTAGASGTYTTLTLTVDKIAWGSVAYEIHAAAYATKHLHRIGGFYQNGNSISGDSGNTVKTSGTTFAISAPASQKFTMTISGGNWVHPIAWVRLALNGNGFLRSDLITFSWS